MNGQDDSTVCDNHNTLSVAKSAYLLNEVSTQHRSQFTHFTVSIVFSAAVDMVVLEATAGTLASCVGCMMLVEKLAK